MLGSLVMFARLLSAFVPSVLTGLACRIGSTQKALDIRCKTADKATIMETAQTDCCAPTQKSSLKRQRFANLGQNRLPSLIQSIINGQGYAFITLFEDSIKWILIVLIIIAIMKIYVPFDNFSRFVSSIWSMLLMVVFPMYICVSTPVVAGLITMSILTGPAVVFMLAGPASNIAIICSVCHLLGRSIESYRWDISANIGAGQVILSSSIFLLLATIKSLRPYLGLAQNACS